MRGPQARVIVYDISRLVTRALNPAPNGIDRVDFALARHFLSNGATPLVFTVLGPRLAEREKALRTLDAIQAYWLEAGDVEADGVYHSLLATLAARGLETRQRSRFQRRRDFARISRNCQSLYDWAFHLGRPLTEVAHGAVYFSATQFLLDRAWHVGWLDSRPDVKLVSFVHDLLPLDCPEYFRPREVSLHPRRNRNVCRFGAGVVVGSQGLAARYKRFAADNGRGDLPICVARLPVSPIFAQPVEPPRELTTVSYFLCCGTIEPRKNHLLLLNVWREMANSRTPPKLILVGKRGWLCENAVDLMSRCPGLGTSVVEANGLSTPGLRRLMAGARAVLMPSFGEGFGLPVAEALVAGVPVIASDLDIFHEIGGPAPDFIHPLDGLGWIRAIMDYAEPDSARRAATLARMRVAPAVNPTHAFFSTVDRFLQSV